MPSLPTVELDWKDSLDTNQVESLPPRTLARFEAFLLGVSLALPSEDPTLLDPALQRSSSMTSISSSPLAEQPLPLFRSAIEKRGSSSSLLTRSVSGSSMGSWNPQISEKDLVIRLELYIRVVQRAKSLRECTIALEPMRAIKARARALVVSFVETASAVERSVLARLLGTLTREVLSVAVLSENLTRIIQRMVSDYERKTSYASLDFLSSPEHAAVKNLTPMVVQYLCHLRSNWGAFEADCEMELLLQLSLDPVMRSTFKTVEFYSMDHLLEVCQEFRTEMQHVQVPAALVLPTSGEEAYDLQREIITVNGHVLPTVKTYDELTKWLSKTLHSRRLRKQGKHGRRFDPRITPIVSYSSASDSESSILSSGADSKPKKHSVDLLAKHVLNAARGKFAHVVACDMFGGEDVQVVPSPMSLPTQSRRETIEIAAGRSGSVTIRRHGSFEVCPKELPGSNPLIQINTMTQETISLEGRKKTQEESGLKMRMVVQS